MFEVIPAIDVADGALAHLTPDGPIRLDAYGGDPLEAAAAMVEGGAEWLHVVDMDLAFHGEARNLDVVSAIAELRVPVQAGGGVRMADEVELLIEAGAARVVVGSAALADEAGTRELLDTRAGRLIIGIEVGGGGGIRSRGRDPVDLPLMETLGWLVAADAPAFLVTAVARVGSSFGPDVAAVKRVVRAGRPVLAAGGITSVDHLRALRTAGAAGAVVGRAVLEGDLDLAEARSALA
jgi:phosphoribosylformimino-5-aminoimidazole carboxamide ribotide isomerase